MITLWFETFFGTLLGDMILAALFFAIVASGFMSFSAIGQWLMRRDIL